MQNTNTTPLPLRVFPAETHFTVVAKWADWYLEQTGIELAVFTREEDGGSYVTTL